MSRRDTMNLRAHLGQKARIPPTKPEEEFWAEFRGRAEGLTRSEPAGRSPVPAIVLSLMLLVTGGIAAIRVIQPFRGAAPGAAVVESIEVDAEHSGVVVIPGGDDTPTIVWILNMSDALGEGNT